MKDDNSIISYRGNQSIISVKRGFTRKDLGISISILLVLLLLYDYVFIQITHVIVMHVIQITYVIVPIGILFWYIKKVFSYSIQYSDANAYTSWSFDYNHIRVSVSDIGDKISEFRLYGITSSDKTNTQTYEFDTKLIRTVLFDDKSGHIIILLNTKDSSTYIPYYLSYPLTEKEHILKILSDYRIFCEDGTMLDVVKMGSK